MNRVYLDYNATTPVEPAVLDAMLPYLSAEFGNASSIHSPGQRARAAVETARDQVAVLIGARPQEIVFTSGGTESDNHAIFGVAQPLLAVPSSFPSPALHVITSTIEHEAVLNTCQALEKSGVAVTYLPVDREGVVDPESVRRALRPETALITIMHANNELGTVQPLEEIGRIAAEADVYFHTDAVQSAVISFTPPKASAHFTFAAEPACSSFSTAAITSAASVPARKTSPELSASARPQSWPAFLLAKTRSA